MVKRIMNDDGEGNGARGKPKFGRMDGVRKALRARDIGYVSGVR